MYSFDSRVRYSECDKSGRLSIVGLIDYLQDCTTFHSDHVGHGLEFMAAHDYAWFIAAWQIHVLRLPRFAEKIRVSTNAYEMGSVTSNRNFSITDEGGEPCVLADSIWFTYDTAAKSPCRIPDFEHVYVTGEPRLDLPRTSLRLPDTLGVGVSQLEVSADALLKTDQIKALIDVIVASLLAALLGGSGLALLAAGAPGLAIGFLVGLLAAVIGTETAERMLRKAELPLTVRRMITPRFFKKSLDKRRDEIRAGVESQLMREIDPPSENVQAMVREIASSIEDQLRRMMERAALMIH